MRSFETGEYRNIFKETGKSDEEIAKKIKDAVFTFFYDEKERTVFIFLLCLHCRVTTESGSFIGGYSYG